MGRIRLPGSRLFSFRGGGNPPPGATSAFRDEALLDPPLGWDTARAMSGDYVDADELTASVLDALNRLDADALVALIDPHVEFHSRVGAVEGRMYRGAVGFREYFRDVREGFTNPRWELEEVLGRQGDDLVVVLRFIAHGRETGVPIDVSMPQVWTFRNGKVWRNVVYLSRDDALRAAGLSE